MTDTEAAASNEAEQTGRRAKPARRQSFVLWACVVALAAAMAGWILYVRYDTQAIYRPIPAHASVVSRHLDVADRWSEWSRNPAAAALIRALGLSETDAQQLGTDAESLKWFRKLAGREMTLAYLPRTRYSAAPAWMAVSWAGAGAQKMRWQLSLFNVPGFEEIKDYPGHSVWKVDAAFTPPGHTLVIAFGEGVLMACLSMDIHSISEVLDAYDGQRPRLLDMEGFWEFATADNRTAPDRIWLGRQSLPDGLYDMAVDISTLTASEITLDMAIHSDFTMPRPLDISISTAPLAHLIGNRACLAFSAQQNALFAALFEYAPPSPSAVPIIRWIQQASQDHLLGFILDGNYAGRLALSGMGTFGLAGVRVPTLMAATPVESADALQQMSRRIIDECNAYYRGSFIFRPETVSETTLYVLESADGKEWVDQMKQADRPAYMELNGWLVISSNFGVLRKMVQEMDENPRPSDAAWMTMAPADHLFSLWGNLPRAGAVVRDLLAFWVMADRSIYTTVNTWRNWTFALAPLGEAAISVDQTGQKIQLRLQTTPL